MKLHSIFLFLILGCAVNLEAGRLSGEMRNRKGSTRSAQEETKLRVVKFSHISQGDPEIVESPCDLACVIKGASYCCVFSSVGGIGALAIEAMNVYLKSKFD